LKGINSGLNNSVKSCTNLIDTLSAVKSFKSKQITRWQEYEKGYFEKKRPETVERHAKLSRIVADFKNMPSERQVQNLFKTSIEIGFLMVDTRAKK